ncbi:hypothetical protein JTE90_002820 [Oedothorax gibbosus]|uniref:Uncharacterized protein n=1 Tax=Oedothorax gibbosus TaxID=931172 RepID=A0AAV6U6X7_9ARAC|nr:hypothetical protein JTE90_002820 [Oedothorax gibbosus]
MTKRTVVAFALGTLIFGIHILNACSYSAGHCKQYGHACLGGHGKRSSNSPLIDMLLHDALKNQEKASPQLSDLDRRNLQDFWETAFNKNDEDWISDGDERNNRQIFN